MADYGMSKNGSVYRDETAFKALMGMAKPGDVWTMEDRKVLILKNQGAYCNCLTLMSEKKCERMIEIISAETFYTDPGMVRYLFNDRLGVFVQRLPMDEFDNVLEAVEEALRFPRLRISRPKKSERHRRECHALLDMILDRTEES